MRLDSFIDAPRCHYTAFDVCLQETQTPTANGGFWPPGARRPFLAAKPKLGAFPARHRLVLNGKEYWYGFTE